VYNETKKTRRIKLEVLSAKLIDTNKDMRLKSGEDKRKYRFMV